MFFMICHASVNLDRERDMGPVVLPQDNPARTLLPRWDKLPLTRASSRHPRRLGQPQEKRWSGRVGRHPRLPPQSVRQFWALGLCPRLLNISVAPSMLQRLTTGSERKRRVLCRGQPAYCGAVPLRVPPES